MTLQQTFAFAILFGMMVMFAWGKLRYDLVAVLGLLIAVLAGIVPYDKAFSGFSDDIVIIVASALLVSAGVARSGVIERAIRPIAPYLTRTQVQVIVLTATVTVLSAFVKNIGALAMMMPVAFQLARRSDRPVSALLMPMSFGALLGGIVTMIGTSPNIIVSRVRQEIVGEPFGMFDFTPVGAGIALVGLLFLMVGYRLLPRGRKGAGSMAAAFTLEGYTTEANVPDDSPLVGKTVGDLEKLAENEVEVIMLLRRQARLPAGRLPDGGGDRRRLRLPHPDRPSMQYAGLGAGRLSLQRLLAAGIAALDHRRSGWRTADRHLLAVPATMIGRYRPRHVSPLRQFRNLARSTA
jgi:di/tricarboxylate transporter